jgi:hypothetical protein
MDALVRDDQRTEILRVTNPDSLVDAVVTEGGVNATTPTSYRVQIVPRGTQPRADHKWDDFRADHVDSLTVTWSSARTLDIGYRNARIFHFSNFWQSAQVRNFDYEVELRLAPRTPSALRAPEPPPGSAQSPR